MKKILLTLLLPLCGLPLMAQDEVTSPSESLDFTVDGITYTILDKEGKTCQTKAGFSSIDYENRKLVFTYGNDIEGAVNIPATVTFPNSTEEYKVVAIGSYGFNKASSVQIAPNGVTTINETAFANNTVLTSITIPEDVTFIGRNAFSECSSLKSISLPSNLTAIYNNTFSYSGLTSIELPSNIVSIGESAFSYCASLKSVIIPSSVIQMGKSAFIGCTNLTSLTLSESITTIPSYAFSGCNNLTEVVIPSSVNSIGDYAFYCAGLKSITSYNKKLPAISAKSFNPNNYTDATLYVYKSSLSSYQNSSLWSAFNNIEPIEVSATGITISPSTLYLNVGLSSQLAAQLSPEEAIGDVVWEVMSSTPTGCVTVDADGAVTARQMGTAFISASCGDISAKCDVIVNSNPEEYIVITDLGQDIYIGDTFTLSAIVFPTTITPSIRWSSSNENVASIDPITGVLKALSDGGTVITATNDNVSASLAITVKPIAANEIILDYSEITLKIGDSTTIKATVKPDNTTYPNVSWESNDPTIAVVSDGTVKAVGVGTANIRAMVGEVTANCVVTVNPILAEKISLNYSAETLKIGQSLQLNATVNPSNTTDPSVTWVSSDASVATVSTNGEVTAINKGATTITATCGNVNASCNITVIPIESEQLIMNYSAISLKVGEAQQLTAAVYPSNTTDQTIQWQTSDAQIANVENGLVTALAPGKITITAKNGSQNATCSVTVEPVIAEQIILDQTNVAVNVNSTVTISANILPLNTTDKNVVWTSLNPEIANVVNGIITGMNPGTTVVTASCGNASASCIVNVLQPATSISLNQISLALNVGDIYDLIATVEPQNTTDIVIWSSSDAETAIVNENGIITALKAGSTIITAICGDKTAKCEVTVSDVVATNITLNLTELNLISGQSYQLVATILPSNTTFPVVTWTSSNPSIATVSEDGAVSAITEGNTKITATCGEVSAFCQVTVKNPEIDEIVLNYQIVNLKASETIQLEIVNPQNLNMKDVDWQTSNSKIATVSANGLITAIAVGDATITASYNGKVASCEVKVNITEAESIELNYTELILGVEESYQLVAKVNPDNTTDPTVKWSSSNEEVAIVSEEGLITTIAEGYSSIIAVCGNVYAICNLTVNGDMSDIQKIQSAEFDGYYRVYNLQGINILTTKQKSDLNNLPRGIYVINGQKILIR